MKTAKRLLSLILCAALLLSGVSLTAGAVSPAKTFPVTLDAQVKEICDEIKADSLLDIESMVTNLPDVSAPARVINKVMILDNGRFSEAMFALRDKCYAADQVTLGKVFYFIGAYFKTFTGCNIVIEEQPDGRNEFIIYLTYEDGSVDALHSSAFYDPETGLFYGKDDKGMFDIGFNFEMSDMVVYATINCWMRNFGFCLAYDIFSYTTPFYYYNTRRFKFYYAGKEWMIQIWKGRYMVANGAEVGVYNRFPGLIGSYYNCVSDEDMLNMSFDLYHDDELLFSRPECKHWWINGFQLSKTLYDAGELTLKFTVEMKDEAMLKAFTKAVKRELHRDVTYQVDGLKVYLVW